MSALTILFIGIAVSAMCIFGLYFTIIEVGRLTHEADRRGVGSPAVPGRPRP